MTVAELVAELTEWPPEYIVTHGEGLSIVPVTSVVGYPKDAEVHLE